MKMKNKILMNDTNMLTTDNKISNKSNNELVITRPQKTMHHKIYFSINTFFIIFCTLFLSQGECYNLDTKHPVVVKSPSKKYYFGHAVDMYTDNNEETWFLVGAPKSRNGKGNIYMYKYTNDQQDAVQVDLSFAKAKTASDEVPELLGWTVKTAQNKQCLVCAPLFTREYVQKSVKAQFYDPIGICYLITNFMSPQRVVYEIKPCADAQATFHDGDEHSHCMAGFSGAFTYNADGLLLGTPGSYYRQGSIMINELPVTSDLTSPPTYIREVSPEIPKDWNGSRDDYLRQSYDDNYLGYSVATGRSNVNSKPPIIAASAPRRFGYDLLGRVVVYDQEMQLELYNFTGKQTGEYFGGSITVTDLNNDNLDDVIVGAPLYSNLERKLIESGRIFIYYQIAKANGLGNDIKLLFSEPVIIEGEKTRARFGHVVTNLGDINLDGYNDIAVGAPYSMNSEDDTSGEDGSIFIFNGGEKGLHETFTQEIHGMNLEENVKSFGYSIAGEKDADHNGYPDIISGAYLSDSVILLRARPVVDILATITAKPSKIDLENRQCSDGRGRSNVACIVITSCFKYKGKSLPPSIDMQYYYDLDSTKTGNDKRLFSLNDAPKNLTLNRKAVVTDGDSQETCFDEIAYLQADIKDKLNKIVIQLSYALIEKDKPIEPILNKLTEPNAFAHVDIAKDCGEDDICQPDLRLATDISPKVAYVGAHTSFKITADVENKADPSYETNLILQYPKNVYYVGMEASQGGVVPTCHFTDTMVMCAIGNPLKRNEKAKVVFKFSASGLQGNETRLPFLSFVNSTNPVDSESKKVNFDMQVEVRSEITIYNTSDPEIIFLNKEKIKGLPETNETAVSHIYQIRNQGPSDIKSALITIHWPSETKNNLYLLEFDEIQAPVSVKCSEGIESSNTADRRKRETDVSLAAEIPSYRYYHCDKEAACKTLQCHVSAFKSQQEVMIKIVSTLLLTTVRDLADAEIQSELQFDITEYPYEINPGPGPTTYSNVTTYTSYDREPVSQGIPWWIILVAVLAGILLLIIVIVCLKKCGFFKRKRKPDDPPQNGEQRDLLNKTNINEDEQELASYLK